MFTLATYLPYEDNVLDVLAAHQMKQVLFGTLHVATLPAVLSGTTTGGSSSTVLIDSGATFQADSVAVGDIVYNSTDNSVAIVKTIDSETQLTCTPLVTGTGNTFDTSDAYTVRSVPDQVILLTADDGANLKGFYKRNSGNTAWVGTSGTVKAAMPTFFSIQDTTQMATNTSNVLGGLFSDDRDYWISGNRGGAMTIGVDDMTSGGDRETRDLTSDYASAINFAGVAKIGSFLYIQLSNGTGSDQRVYRFDAQDLAAGGTLMTVSGDAFGTTISIQSMISDGTDLWFNNTGGDANVTKHIWRQYTISGTVLTSSSTVTCGSTSADFDNGGGAIDASGNFYGQGTSDRLIRRFDSSGTLQATSSLAMGAASHTNHNIEGTIYHWRQDAGNSVNMFHKMILLP